MNKIKELEKENKELKKLIEEYKYKYYEKGLVTYIYVYQLTNNEIINDETNNDDYHDYYGFRKEIKNKILKTKNKKYKNYNIKLKELINIFYNKFFLTNIINLLKDDENINKYINKYYYTLLEIHSNDYIYTSGAEPFNDLNERTDIIEYLLKYYNITSEDIDNEILKQQIVINIKNYVLKNIMKDIEYNFERKNKIFNFEKKNNVLDYNFEFELLISKDELLDLIVKYLNNHDIKNKFDINYLENYDIKKIIDNWCLYIKKKY